MDDPRIQYIDKLEKMYAEDVAELQAKLDEMTKDRDRWRDMADKRNKSKKQPHRRIR